MKIRKIKLKTLFTFKKLGIISICFIIGSCVSNNKILKEQQLINKKDSQLIENYKKGIDFVAEGNDPIPWQLKLDFDRSFDFLDNENFNVSCTPVNPTTKPNGIEIYEVISGKTVTIITISEKISNQKSLKIKNYKTVEVSCNNRIYRGLGEFTHFSNLHDIWYLEKIGASNYFKKKNIHHQPWLKFDLINNNAIVCDGIKHLKGDMNIKGNYIQFYSFTKTKNKKNEFTEIFKNQIENHFLEYYFIENKLVLLLNDDRRITFKKKN